MLVEKRICDVDGKLIIYHENLKRLRKRLEVLKQIHDAPNIYAFLVVEVVRRRKFSSTFTEVCNYLFLSGNITELLNETNKYSFRDDIHHTLGVHLLLYGRTLKMIIVSYFFMYDATILNFESRKTCLNRTLSKPES